MAPRDRGGFGEYDIQVACGNEHKLVSDVHASAMIWAWPGVSVLCSHLGNRVYRDLR